MSILKTVIADANDISIGLPKVVITTTRYLAQGMLRTSFWAEKEDKVFLENLWKVMIEIGHALPELFIGERTLYVLSNHTKHPSPVAGRAIGQYPARSIMPKLVPKSPIEFSCAANRRLGTQAQVETMEEFCFIAYPSVESVRLANPAVSGTAPILVARVYTLTEAT